VTVTIAFTEDTIIYPTMISLTACLCTEIAQSGLPEPCACSPIVGELVLDYCSSCAEGNCGGQAWVRLVDAYPSLNFPVRQQAVSNCFAPLAFTLEVGIVRCKPMGSNSTVRGFTPPTVDQTVTALRLQLADMAAMRRAIQCCFGNSDDRSYIMGSYVPVTPEGDCLGGYFSVSVWSV
jgi:hypothetical protein